MSTAVITKRIAKTSPRFERQDFNASNFGAIGFRGTEFGTKTAGVIYLFSVLAVAFATIIVRGELSVVGSLIMVLAMTAVTLLFYAILRPLNRHFSLLAASFNLGGLVFEIFRLQPRGANLAVVFNGFFCILIGCLALRSTLLPRILGALMVLGGLGWLTFLLPPLTNYLAPYNLAFGLLGEGSVCLWLLLARVNAGRGNERPSAA